MKLQRMIWTVISLFVGLGVVVIWQLIADAKIISPVFLPGPDRAWQSIVRGFENGVLPAQIGATITRMFLGWVTASILGIALGALIGASLKARALFEPTLEVLRPLPASAVIPLAIALLGLTDVMVVVVIGFGALLAAALGNCARFWKRRAASL
jgi:sulfonate transport system permease protein